MRRCGSTIIGGFKMNLKQAKSLYVGQVVYHKTAKNADKTPVRFRVSGAVKTWKRDKKRIKVPVKYGLYYNAYLTNGTVEGHINHHIKDFKL